MDLLKTAGKNSVSIFTSIQCPVMIAVGGRKICDANNLTNNNFQHDEFTDLNHYQMAHLQGNFPMQQNWYK